MFHSLFLEQFFEGAPEASFVLLPTPLTEGCVVVLLCPTPPLCLVPPGLDPRVLSRLNTILNLFVTTAVI